jgi:hypothetical protein
LLPEREAPKRLGQGDDPLDVLAWLLGNEAPDDDDLDFRGPHQMADQDPLQAYGLLIAAFAGLTQPPVGQMVRDGTTP